MADHDHADHGDHGGVGKYLGVFLALCVLTSASFFTYSSYWPFQDTPIVGRLFMMFVSCLKALLVMLFFMHLLWESSWKFVLTIPPLIMALLLMLLLVPDIGLRGRIASEEHKQHMAQPVAEEHAEEHHDPEHHDPAAGDPAHEAAGAH